MELAIITPTYKRKSLLEKLYQSLKKQKCKEFEWIIVNDGSPDDTDDYVKTILDETNFKITYFYQNNSGKAVAVNKGLDLARNSVFALIVDDDEILYDDAVEQILKYVRKYADTNCGGIEFLRNDLDGKPIGNYVREDFFMGIQERKRKKLYIDGYTGYFVDKVGDMRAPILKNERYIGPGVLQTMVSDKYELLWPNVAIGTTEYLEGGLTKRGRKLRLENPKGMILYSVLMQHKKSGFFLRFLYSGLGYAYKIYGKVSNKDLLSENIDIRKFNKLAFIPGFVLYLYWKIKY